MIQIADSVYSGCRLDNDEEDNGSGRDSDANELLESDLENVEALDDSDNDEEEDVDDEGKVIIGSDAQDDDDEECNTSGTHYFHPITFCQGTEKGCSLWLSSGMPRYCDASPV